MAPICGCVDSNVPGFSPALPDMNRPCGSKCPPSPCVQERIKAKRFAIRECSGSSSQRLIPCTLVEIGMHGPRTSLGASGFRSYVSNWLGPPCRKRKMTAVSFGKVSLAAALWRSRVARLMPPIPSKPACNAPRRLMAGELALLWVLLSVIEFPAEFRTSCDFNMSIA